MIKQAKDCATYNIQRCWEVGRRFPLIKSLACVEGGYFGLFAFSFVVRKRYSGVKAEPENDGRGCERKKAVLWPQNGDRGGWWTPGVTSTTKCNLCVV